MLGTQVHHAAVASRTAGLQAIAEAKKIFAAPTAEAVGQIFSGASGVHFPRMQTRAKLAYA